MAGVFLASAGPWRDRVLRSILFSTGVTAGLALCGGLWMAHLYRAYGNPTFPYFNGVFHSPYAASGSNRDATFQPHGLLDTVLFPFRFTLNSRRVAEYDFRDSHIALAYIAVPLALLSTFFRRKKPENAGTSVMANFLFVFFAVSYAAWMLLFAIYRYLLPLEMIAPLVIVMAVLTLPVPRRAAVTLCIALLLGCQASIRAGYDRKPWEAHYVRVELPYAVPADATLLLAGNAPMGYVVTALPSSVPAIRAGSYLAVDNLFAASVKQRIAAASGPLYVLFAPGDRTEAQTAVAAHGLSLDPQCGFVTSNVAAPLSLCPAHRS